MSFNNQAVVELKLGNFVQALNLSKKAASILEIPVFNNDQPDINTVNALLVSYFNLGVCYEYLDESGNSQSLFHQGIELSEQFGLQDQLLYKKFRNKLFEEE